MATTNVQFVNFPAEIILKVLGYLEKEDLFKCSLISRRLRTICQFELKIWENIHLYNPNPICEYFMNTCTNDDQNSHKMPGCLNINSKKVHGQSLQYILDKGCNYLVLSHIAECENLVQSTEMEIKLSKYFEPFKMEVLGTASCTVTRDTSILGVTKDGIKSYHVLLTKKKMETKNRKNQLRSEIERDNIYLP